MWQWTRIVYIVLIAASSCAPGGGHPPADAGPADAGTPPPPDLVRTGDMHWDPANGAGISGLVVDEKGQAIAGIQVLGCTAMYCLFANADQDGRFLFSMYAPPIDVVVKTPEDDKLMPRRAESLVPVHLADNSLTDVGTLYVPSLPAGMDLGPPASDPQTVMAGDGLQLTLRRADLAPPLGGNLSNVAARAIPAAHIPPLPALGAEKVLAVYALCPFSATSTSPISVKAPSTLASGTAVNFRTISEIDGHLSAPATGKADGSYVTTDPGQGLTDLTWLVISR